MSKTFLVLAYPEWDFFEKSHFSVHRWLLANGIWTDVPHENVSEILLSNCPDFGLFLTQLNGDNIIQSSYYCKFAIWSNQTATLQTKTAQVSDLTPKSRDFSVKLGTCFIGWGPAISNQNRNHLKYYTFIHFSLWTILCWKIHAHSHAWDNAQHFKEHGKSVTFTFYKKEFRVLHKQLTLLCTSR